MSSPDALLSSEEKAYPSSGLNFGEQQLYDHDLIEGIGNEVLFGVCALTIILAFLFFVIRRFENVSRVSRIHPSNLIAVNDARQQQQNNSQNPQNNGTEASPFIPGTRTRFGSVESNCPVCLNQLHLPIETNCGHLFCGRCIIIYWQHAQWRGGAIRCPVCRQGVNILLPCFSTNVGSSSANSSLTQSLSSAIVTATTDLLNYLLSFLSFGSSNSAQLAPTSTNSSDSNGTSSGPSPFSASSTTANGSGVRARTRPEEEQPDDLLNQNLPRQTDPNTERVNVIREINTYNRRFSGEPRPWSDYLYDLPTLLRHLTNDFFSFNGLMYMFRIRIVLCVVAAIMYLISPLDMIPEAVFGIFGLFDDIVVVLLLAIYVTIIYRRFLSSRWEMD